MKKFSALRKAAFASCLLLSQISILFAQEQPFIKAIQVGEITLTANEYAFYQSHLNSPLNSSVIITQIGNVADHLENQLLTFTIPGTSTSITVQPEYVESNSTTNYSWAGTASESGYFSITNNEGFKAGFIQKDNEAWSILPLRENYSLLIKRDASVRNNVDCAVEGGTTATSTVNNCNEEYNTCNAVIDVLLFFTSTAKDLVSAPIGIPPYQISLNMDAYVKILEHSVNLAFTRSDIPNKRVRFRWVVYNPSYGSNPNIVALVNNFAADATANQMMNSTYRADLGVFITHISFSNATGYATIGNANDPGPSFRHAGASVGDLLAPTWTLAHEITHMLGAQHNWCNNVPCNNPGCACSERDFCAHGYRFDAGGQERKTIHAIVNQAGNVRILQFSNPDVSFLGVPTGATGDEPANNARIIRNTGCSVSGYAPSPEVSAMISGLPLLCGLDGVFTPKTYSASIIQPAQGFPGIPPYTVQWWINETGAFSYQSPDVFLGNGNQITINQIPNCDFFYLHIRVQSADGVTFTSTRVIKAYLCSDCTGARLTTGVLSSSSDGAPSIKLYPNPTSGDFFLEIVAETEMEGGFSISSLDGKLLLDLGKFNLKNGLNKINFVAIDLPSGLYMLHFGSPSQRQSILVSFQKN